MAEVFNTEGMLELYLLENCQLLDRIQEIVLDHKEEPFDDDSMNEIYRAMHTMKGTSTLMMFDGIRMVAHKLEDVFSYLKESRPKQVSHSELVEVILNVSDFIRAEMEKLGCGKSADGDAKGLCKKLDSFLAQLKQTNGCQEPDAGQVVEDVPKHFYIAPKTVENAPIFQIDLDSSVEEIEARMQQRQAAGGTPEIAPGDFVLQPKSYGKSNCLRKGRPAFIQVDSSKMEQLALSLEQFQRTVGELSQISMDMQNLVRSLYLVPLTQTFQKMNRIVFDASKKLGKDIEFEMVGEQTEADKNIVSHISAPLMHLVRNAVDHGIETKKERKLAGKKERGRIFLSAKKESGILWICVEDDGIGLNREKILKKAREKQLLDPSVPDSAYSDEEVYQLITLPGFSTNENVTQYSGRGVGMDVVLQDIQQVGGTLEIKSVPGNGCKMTIKIPLLLPQAEGGFYE